MTENAKARTPRTCFVVMPISDREGYQIGHWSRVFNGLLAPAIRAAGFEPTLASSDQRANVIHVEIIRQLVGADLVVCDISSLNPNVMFELGIRQAFDRPVVLVKDELTDSPFDVIPLRYEAYDSSLRFDQVAASIAKIASVIDATMADTQGNSLVSLVEIEAAALPGRSDMSEADAQFSVLHKKLDSLAMQVSGLTSAVSLKDEIVQAGPVVQPGSSFKPYGFFRPVSAAVKATSKASAAKGTAVRPPVKVLARARVTGRPPKQSDWGD